MEGILRRIFWVLLPMFLMYWGEAWELASHKFPDKAHATGLGTKFYCITGLLSSVAAELKSRKSREQPKFSGSQPWLFVRIPWGTFKNSDLRISELGLGHRYVLKLLSCLQCTYFVLFWLDIKMVTCSKWIELVVPE